MQPCLCGGSLILNFDQELLFSQFLQLSRQFLLSALAKPMLYTSLRVLLGHRRQAISSTAKSTYQLDGVILLICLFPSCACSFNLPTTTFYIKVLIHHHKLLIKYLCSIYKMSQFYMVRKFEIFNFTSILKCTWSLYYFPCRNKDCSKNY